jgi:hypothetical protein
MGKNTYKYWETPQAAFSLPTMICISVGFW